MSPPITLDPALLAFFIPSRVVGGRSHSTLSPDRNPQEESFSKKAWNPEKYLPTKFTRLKLSLPRSSSPSDGFYHPRTSDKMRHSHSSHEADELRELTRQAKSHFMFSPYLYL